MGIKYRGVNFTNPISLLRVLAQQWHTLPPTNQTWRQLWDERDNLKRQLAQAQQDLAASTHALQARIAAAQGALRG